MHNEFCSDAVPSLSGNKSRGLLIKSLLKHVVDNVISPNQEIIVIQKFLEEMALTQYQPFTLCVFSSQLNTKTANSNNDLAESSDGCNYSTIQVFQWNGKLLTTEKASKVITSSGKNIVRVTNKRKLLYQQIIDEKTPTAMQHQNYHFSQQQPKSDAVNMFRDDAQTVSFSHIIIDNDISFSYFDLLNDKWTKLNHRRQN